MTKSQQQLTFRMAIVGLAILSAGLIYFFFFSHAKVSVEVVPTSAVVTLDNKPAPIINGSATFVAGLGHHTLRVEADNYVGFKQELDLSRGDNFSKKIALEKAPSPIKIGGGTNIASKDNNLFYLNTADRLLYMSKINYDPSGQASVASTQPIISKPLGNFDQLLWSPNRDLILMKSGSSVSILDFQKYDFLHQNIVSFGSNIGDIAWSPDNSRLAYYYAPPSGERSLIFSDANNQNIVRAANLARLNIINPFIAFSPDSQYLAIIPRNTDANQNQLFLMNIYTREIKKIIADGNLVQAAFSADSKKLVYSSFDGSAGNPLHQLIFSVNSDGSDKTALGIAVSPSSAIPWQNPNQLFLPINSSRSKMILVGLDSGKTSEFYFVGQANSPIGEAILNDDKTGAFFTSNGNIFFVKLVSN